MKAAKRIGRIQQAKGGDKMRTIGKITKDGQVIAIRGRKHESIKSKQWKQWLDDTMAIHCPVPGL